jgi:hypothetical protein
MFLRGHVWLLPPGAAMRAGGYGWAVALAGGMMAIVYEFAHRLPLPSRTPPHWPFGPQDERMIDGSTGWAEAVWGAYVWLVFIAAVLGQGEEGLEADRRRRASWNWHPDSPDRRATDARRLGVVSSGGYLGGGVQGGHEIESMQPNYALDGGDAGWARGVGPAATRAVGRRPRSSCAGKLCEALGCLPAKASCPAKFCRAVLLMMMAFQVVVTALSLVMVVYVAFENHCGKY